MEELDAAVVRAWALGARASLDLARPHIDAVNVFPVADGDTGTNVLLTVDGGVTALAALPVDASTAAAARAFAHGAMLAARGNSGVIVSQYLAGFAASLPEAPGPTQVAEALAAAAREARGAVADPQEGTVLTLADAVGTRAARAAADGASTTVLLTAAVADAHRALARISAEHPVLRRAHVLDAGACALLVVLDALVAAVRGEAPAAGAPDWLPSRPATLDGVPEPTGAFEVMLLVHEPEGAGGDLGAELRSRMHALGDSVAVVGADGWWHVHVHTDDPERAVAEAALGPREQAVVRLVDSPHAASASEEDPGRWGLVACTSSPALAAWYATAGAVTVVRCPEAPVSTAHLVRAVADTGARSVAVLPGGAVEGDVLAELLATERGPVVEVLDAADELRTVVATLAFAGAVSSSATHAAVLALGRVRAAAVDGDLVAGVDALLGAVGTPGDLSLTVLHRDDVEPGTADRLAELLGARTDGVEPVLVGPTGSGPRFVVGID
ncbi:putative phosphatase/kinase [Cellulomonas chitinilytica]|uniref:Phosphatase/kinase n=1 Tax=Cellulomonas chitinilytica TaxID=398759 RepID=A0A919P1U2_9CELL|nr:DAK2 domain-containing protein [Cellulomonas chitinilytica]GIG20116.1 putative phosphatase/kinase [Cellulomonas chitinilytica]